MPVKERKALAATLTDLHYGFLAIGGETSIGRGLFNITKVNGKEMLPDLAENSAENYKLILSEIEEAFG